MSYEAAREALISHIKTNWEASAFAATPVEWENLEAIDHNLQKDPFLSVEIDWRDAEQAALNDRAQGDRPPKRQHGEIAVYVHVKEGTGTKLALQMTDVLDGFLTFKRVSGIQLQALRPMQGVPVKGWRIMPLRVSFYYDD